MVFDAKECKGVIRRSYSKLWKKTNFIYTLNQMNSLDRPSVRTFQLAILNLSILSFSLFWSSAVLWRSTRTGALIKTFLVCLSRTPLSGLQPVSRKFLVETPLEHWNGLVGNQIGGPLLTGQKSFLGRIRTWNRNIISDNLSHQRKLHCNQEKSCC